MQSKRDIKMIKTNKKFMHYIFPVYWVLLLLWQTFRPVENRSMADIGVKALLLGSLLTFVILKSYYKKLNLAGLLLLVLYVLFQFLSHWNNYDIFKLSYLIDTVFSFSIIFTFMILNNDYVITKDEMILFSKIIVGIVFALCIYADVFRFEGIIAALKTSSGYLNAVKSILASNHEFGLYLSFGIVSCVFLIFNSHNSLKNYLLYGFLIILFTFNLILTFSRTSLASLVIAALIAIHTMKKHRFAFLCMALLLLAVILLNNDLREYFLKIVLRVQHDGNRFNLIKGGLKYYAQGSIKDILIGVGPTGSQLYVREISGGRNFHNGYITVLVTGGLAMMTFFIYIAVCNINNGIKTLRYDRCSGAYMLASNAIMLLYMWGQTPIIFSPDLVSSMLTFYCIIVPRYFYNFYRNQITEEKRLKTAGTRVSKIKSNLLWNKNQYLIKDNFR